MKALRKDYKRQMKYLKSIESDYIGGLDIEEVIGPIQIVTWEMYNSKLPKDKTIQQELIE